MTAAAFGAAALCLEYPDEAWRANLPLLERAAGSLSSPPLSRFVAYASASSAEEMTRGYVATFDLRRRCCPYLTYYSFGDTRKRGMALLRFTAAYRAAGFTVGSGELPDHLAVVCEFATRRPQAGIRLLTQHRAGLELLHLALSEAASPYAEVTGTIRAALPDPAPRDLAQALELARAGPPEEEVGLEPFAPPEYPGARR
ncbi:MAG TPA: nitrate reductase molybdenum cofactor assembly chaperone [Jatrophihabitans sp.]|nr:nitrate reductase molybdenum cofactor assembly chaperone [Jatrophihabitans sp.]